MRLYKEKVEKMRELEVTLNALRWNKPLLHAMLLFPLGHWLLASDVTNLFGWK